MNCKCEKFEGSTTIMCCNKCKLPLKNEPWSILESSVKNGQFDALVREKIAKMIDEEFMSLQGDVQLRAILGNGTFSLKDELAKLLTESKQSIKKKLSNFTA